MRHIALLAALLAPVTMLLWGSVAADGGVVYREVFPNDATNTTNIMTVAAEAETGWMVHMGATAVKDVGPSGWRVSWASLDTSPTAAAAVHSNPQRVPNENRGYLWHGADVDDKPNILWTDEYTVDRSIWNITEIAWWQNNVGGDTPLRVALQIDGNWYASAYDYRGTTAVRRSLDFATTNWLSLSFVPDASGAPGSLALGSSTTLPTTGDISAFGWFTETRTNQIRLDSFEIQADPTDRYLIYREIFPNDGSGSNIYSTDAKGKTGWTVHYGPNAAEDDTSGGGWRISRDPLDTSATAAIGVNSNPQLVPPDNEGYVWHGTGDTGVANILWTDEYTVDRSEWAVTEIRWTQRNVATDPIRIAVQIGDDWYASDEDFAGTGLRSQSLDFTTAQWRSLDFDPGSSLVLGSLTTLPGTGDITAFGWFTDSRTNTLKLDSFEIRGVPEPAAALLLSLALMAMAAWRRGAIIA